MRVNDTNTLTDGYAVIDKDSGTVLGTNLALVDLRSVGPVRTEAMTENDDEARHVAEKHGVPLSAEVTETSTYASTIDGAAIYTRNLSAHIHADHDPMPAGQARALADEDGRIEVIVDADLVEMMQRHQYGQSGGDDEHDYLHGLAFAEGVPHASHWSLVTTTGPYHALVLYTTSVEGMPEQSSTQG